MARIGTRLLVLTVGGTDYTSDVSSVVISADDTDSDFVSYADAATGGGRTYTLKLTLVQDPATTALFDKVWSAAGTTVAYVIKPFGITANGGPATATPTQPWYSGSVVISEPNGDLIGGDADKSVTGVQTIDVEWVCTAKPTKATS